LKLFENYLANRTHFVSIEDIQSQKASVTCDVPQGSNLGALFFLLYVNDITHVSKFKTYLFADDTVLSFSAKSVTDLKKKVNEELNNIDNWLKHNKLSLNCNKTQYMMITKQKIPLNFDMNISINNHIISKVDNLKYLGVVLGNKLTWNSHIAQVKKQISQACGAHTRLRHYLPINSLITVYYSLVFSHLQYGISSWGSASTYLLKTIKTIQNKFIRLIAFSSYGSNAEKLYAQLKILNLNDIYKLQIAKLMHKFKHDCLPSVFNHLFTKLDNIHSYNTRQKTFQEYIVPRKILAIAQKSLAYTGVKIWESLDQNLKVQPFYIFKKKCKLHFLNQY